MEREFPNFYFHRSGGKRARSDADEKAEMPPSPEPNLVQTFVKAYHSTINSVINRETSNIPALLSNIAKAQEAINKLNALTSKNEIPKALKISTMVHLPKTQKEDTDAIHAIFRDAESKALALLIKAREKQLQDADKALVDAIASALAATISTLAQVKSDMAEVEPSLYDQVCNHFVLLCKARISALKLQFTVKASESKAKQEARAAKLAEEKEHVVADPKPSIQQLVNQTVDKKLTEVKNGQTPAPQAGAKRQRGRGPKPDGKTKPKGKSKSKSQKGNSKPKPKPKPNKPNKPNKPKPKPKQKQKQGQVQPPRSRSRSQKQKQPRQKGKERGN